MTDIEAQLTATNVEFDKIETCLQKALDYAMNCGKSYLGAGPQERRLLNQALSTRIEITEDDVRAELAEPFKTLFSDEVSSAARQHAAITVEAANEQPNSSASLTDVLRRTNDKPAHAARV